MLLSPTQTLSGDVDLLHCEIGHLDSLTSAGLGQSKSPGPSGRWLRRCNCLLILWEGLVKVSPQRPNQESIARAEWCLCDSPPPPRDGAGVRGKRGKLMLYGMFC